MVVPAIVGAHLYLVAAFLEVRRKVEAESHDTVLAQSHVFAVDKDLGTLSGTLKLDEHTLAFSLLRQSERLAIPDDGVA